MLFSLITPTHDPKFLPRLEASLKAQTCQDFEWIVMPNGAAAVATLALPQARLVSSPSGVKGIGHLKGACAALAQGRFIVEVDHDDELTPDALAELQKAFEAPDSPDFVWSNCIEVLPDGTSNTYSKSYGWEYRPFVWQGRVMQEQLAFPAIPAAFANIWYAPNHVRAWRRAFYNRIGGHAADLDVLDDQDLMARSYIHGVCRGIDKCLYVYHIHAQNSCKGEKNAKIQSFTWDLYDKYTEPMVCHWADLNGLRKIDLCSGAKAAAGYEGVDLVHGPIKADLNTRWPFEDGSVGIFRAQDALEHLRDPLHTMKEVYRCLAPNGWLISNTPSTDGRGAFQDPTHVSFWNSNSAWYYTKATQAQFIGTPVKFQAKRVKDYYPSKWHEQHRIAYVRMDLMKFHGRVPGLIEI